MSSSRPVGGWELVIESAPDVDELTSLRVPHAGSWWRQRWRTTSGPTTGLRAGVGGGKVGGRQAGRLQGCGNVGRTRIDTRTNDRDWCRETMRINRSSVLGTIPTENGSLLYRRKLIDRSVMLGVIPTENGIASRHKRKTIEPGFRQVRLRDLGMEGITSEGATATFTWAVWCPSSL